MSAVSLNVGRCPVTTLSAITLAAAAAAAAAIALSSQDDGEKHAPFLGCVTE